MYFESRYFWIVLTFVGDSTITNDFPGDLFATPSPLPAAARANRLPSSCRTRPASSSSSKSAVARPAATPLRSMTSSIVTGSSPSAASTRPLSPCSTGTVPPRVSLPVAPFTQACQRAGSAAITSSASWTSAAPS